MSPAPGNGRLKVWYVSHYAGGPGVGRHMRAWALARAWAETGIEATVIASARHHLLDAPQEPGDRMVDGVDYHFVDTPSYTHNGMARLVNMLAFAQRLPGAARRLVKTHGRPDAIIASSPHPYAFLATHFLARRLGAASLLEVRDLWPESLVDLIAVPRWHPLVVSLAMVERYAYARADHVVSLLPGTRAHMEARGLRPGHWSYIPNGASSPVGVSAGPSSPAFHKLRAWQAEDARVLLYAGALGPPNNMGPLIEALEQLEDGSRPVRCLIVGRGALEAELKRLATRLVASDRVAFFSQVPVHEAQALMRAADIGYFSIQSRPLYSHGISANKIFDYMKAGLPILAAMRAGNDPVTEAGCGHSVDPENAGAIAMALSEMAALPDAELREMGARGRGYVDSHHDYERLARTYAELIGSLRETTP